MDRAVSQISISVTPHPQDVSRVLDAVEGFANGISLTARTANRLNVLVEELTANVCMHSGSATRIAVTVTLNETSLEVTVEDDGPAFDPTLRAVRTVDEDLDSAEIGGLGISLVRQMASSIEYVRTDLVNKVIVTLDL